ncbi:MAG: UDP-2,3-diacylglucosamine diphosphatase [Gemmatimonadota bacterium]|nr:MAG: UDP-2,3-diacylglucosamine diphosphatase [Gemmatimonadota bacterium]
MSKPTVIVSDLHLGAVPESIRSAFSRFVRRWLGKAETLLINGDLFDYWFEFRSVVPGQHFHTLRALADLRESGVELILVGGNHDAWGGAFLEKTIGIELLQGPAELQIAGRRALIAHGDGLGPGDLGYKALRRVLRSRPVVGAMRWVHPDLAAWIARKVTRTGAEMDRGNERSLVRAAVLEEYAEKLLEERPDLDLVVFGHCHLPQVKRVGPRGYYINSGDWVTHRTYTLVTADSIEQHECVE